MDRIFSVAIPTVKEVYAFVENATKSVAGSAIYAKRDKVVVPCTSIMGMFSIDPSEPFEVIVPEDKEDAEFIKYISQFSVGEVN